MKKIIPVLMLVLALSSCATKTVTRTELFTPTTATLINKDELIEMKYYGADNEYDYFTRGFQRLRVPMSENAVPSFARFTFNNWQNGKKYTDCLKESTSNKLLGWLSGANTTATQTTTNTVNTATNNTTLSPANQQRLQHLQAILQTIATPVQQ